MAAAHTTVLELLGKQVSFNLSDLQDFCVN
jgi:hypothetical protein